MSSTEDVSATRPRYILAQRHVSAIALTQKHAYWTYHGRERQPMRRAPLGRLQDKEDVAPSLLQPNDLRTTASGDGVVYTLARATEGDAPGQVFREVGEGPPELIATEQVQPGRPLDVGGRVYWVEYVNDTGLMSKGPGPSLARIRFRRPGGPIETVEGVTDFSDYIVIGETVCAVSVLHDFAMIGPVGGPLRRIDAAALLGAPVLGPGGIAYATAAPGHFEPADRIVSISEAGVETVVSGAGRIGEIAGDATHLYWASPQGIHRWSPSAGAPELILEQVYERPIPKHSITVGPTAIAWAVTQGRLPVESTIFILPKAA